MCECQINSDDFLVLYTNEVTESSHVADEEFGELRLVDAPLSPSRVNGRGDG